MKALVFASLLSLAAHAEEPASAAAPTTSTKQAVGSPWSVLGLVGGGLCGMGAGVIGVSSYVLATEGTTTSKSARTGELIVGSVALAAGISLIVVDGLTE